MIFLSLKTYLKILIYRKTPNISPGLRDFYRHIQRVLCVSEQGRLYSVGLTFGGLIFGILPYPHPKKRESRISFVTPISSKLQTTVFLIFFVFVLKPFSFLSMFLISCHFYVLLILLTLLKFTKSKFTPNNRTPLSLYCFGLFKNLMKFYPF